MNCLVTGKYFWLYGAMILASFSACIVMKREYHIKNIILLSLLLTMFSCNSGNKHAKVDVITDVKEQAIYGEVVIRGDDDLILFGEIILLDSLLVLINDRRMYNYGSFFHVYDLSDFKKRYSFGNVGMGPEDFITPLSFKSKRKDGKSFNIDDLNQGRLSKITIINDEIVVDAKTTISPLLYSFDMNLIHDTLYFGKKIGYPQGLYFKYNTVKDTLSWVDYPSAGRRDDMHENYLLYYNKLCVSEKKEIAVVALRYFNKILFFDSEGIVLKELQIGEQEIYPLWNNSTSNVDSTSRFCFCDIDITDKYIYCLWNGSKGSVKSERIVFIFDWNYRCITTLKVDYPINSIKVSNDDAYMLSIVEDGTGLSNIVKYDLQPIWEK